MTSEKTQVKLPPLFPNKIHKRNNSQSLHQSLNMDDISHLLKPCKHLTKDCSENLLGSKVYQNDPSACSCLIDFEPRWSNLRDRFVSLKVGKILTEEKKRRDSEMKDSKLFEGRNSPAEFSSFNTNDSLMASLVSSPRNLQLSGRPSIKRKAKISKRGLDSFRDVAKFFDLHPYYKGVPSFIAPKIVLLKDYLHLLYELGNIPANSFMNEILMTLSLPEKMLGGFVHEFEEECKLSAEEKAYIEQEIIRGTSSEEIVQQFKRPRKREHAEEYVKGVLLRRTLTAQEMVRCQHLWIDEYSEESIAEELPGRPVEYFFREMDKKLVQIQELIFGGKSDHQIITDLAVPPYIPEFIQKLMQKEQLSSAEKTALEEKCIERWDFSEEEIIAGSEFFSTPKEKMARIYIKIVHQDLLKIQKLRSQGVQSILDKNRGWKKTTYEKYLTRLNDEKKDLITAYQTRTCLDLNALIEKFSYLENALVERFFFEFSEENQLTKEEAQEVFIMFLDGKTSEDCGPRFRDSGRRKQEIAINYFEKVKRENELTEDDKEKIYDSVMVIREIKAEDEFQAIQKQLSSRHEKVLRRFYDPLPSIRKEIKEDYLGSDNDVNLESLSSKFPAVPEKVISKFRDLLDEFIALTNEEKKKLEECFFDNEDPQEYILKMEFKRKRKLAKDYYEQFKKENDLTEKEKEKIYNLVMVIQEIKAEDEFNAIQRELPDRNLNVLHRFYNPLPAIRNKFKEDYLESDNDVELRSLSSQFPGLPEKVISKFKDLLDEFIALTKEEKRTIKSCFREKRNPKEYISKMKFKRKRKLANDYYALMENPEKMIEESIEKYRLDCEKIECVKDLIFKIANLSMKENKEQKIEVKTAFFSNKDKGVNVTSCLKCVHSCHTKCNHKEKEKCIAMDKDELCTECTGKCHRMLHKTTDYIFEVGSNTETKTLGSLEKQYNCNETPDIPASTQLLRVFIEQLKELVGRALAELDTAGKNLRNLEILKDLTEEPYETSEYVENIIFVERRKKASGLEKRVMYLTRIQKEIKNLIKEKKAKKNLKLKRNFHPNFVTALERLREEIDKQRNDGLTLDEKEYCKIF